MKRFSVVLFGCAAAILLAVGCGSESSNAGGASGGESGATGALTGGSTSVVGTGGSGGSFTTGSGGLVDGMGGLASNTGGSMGPSGGTSSGGSVGSTGGASGGSTGGTTLGTGGATGTVGSGGASGSGGSDGGIGGTSAVGGAGSGGLMVDTGGIGPGGATDSGGSPAGGAEPAGGAPADGGTGGSAVPVDCSSEAAIISYPALPGASQSPLYTVTANGAPQFVEKLTKFAQEMQVHYAHFSLASGCTASISVTVAQGISSYTLSPKSRNLNSTRNGNTVDFDSGPNYLILQFDSKELLFILIDDQESDPPQLGDANVKDLAEYNADNTGATMATTQIQAAIDAASGSAQNILYVPPGRYKVGELWLKSDMTLYLAGGAILDGSTNTGDYSGPGGPAVENTSHSVLHMNDVSNTNVFGRGVIDGNGSVIRGTDNDTPSFKINVLRIDESHDVLIDGIVVRDPVFWNTLIYNSERVTFQNYKVINRRPTTTTYNQTDGIDFDCSSNGYVYNAFIYSGDDSMSPKREAEGSIDTNTIVYEHVVAYTNSAATKIGTKTFGSTIDGIVFRDIDIVRAGRAMAIDANDTARITNPTWEDIRVEAADSSLIDIEEDRAPDWRDSPNTSTVRNAFFTNVKSDVRKVINIHGKSSSVNVDGVHFSGLTIQGQAINSQSGSNATWDVNQYVSNITFQ